ncbi:MAG: exodeoxyribonuclease V subunit alpha [Rhodocyclaceae bacterium]|nr:exodeoxyribonuclease V subunit alpha [Rhodocyclaceae bacterium]
MIPCLPSLPPVPALPGEMQALLAGWAERGWLREIDAALAGFLWREVPEADPLLILAAALASHQLGRGHACLDLQATLAEPAFALSLPPDGADALDTLPSPMGVLDGLSLDAWRAALDCPALVDDGSRGAPLVLVGNRLYLQRYWRCEQVLAAAIAARLDSTGAAPAEAIRPWLDALFPERATIDWQKAACALAARSRFAVITGGPGTGKTTTVLRLLALLQATAMDGAGGGRPLRIRLAAPTGKAAARLNESIAAQVATLKLDALPDGEAVRAAIPRQVTTLHRLLGSRPGSRRFRHDAEHPLPLDMLVIDEASMVDLELMAAAAQALPLRARLVLIGDRDQLSSVEAGAVLGQLCAHAAAARYTPATATWLEVATGHAAPGACIDPAGRALDQAVVMLRHSYRFDDTSGIGRLARAVNGADTAGVAQVLGSGADELAWLPGDGAGTPLTQRIVEGYRGYLARVASGDPGADARDAWAAEVLAAHAGFQVLCALRAGPWGVEGLNARIAAALQAAGLIPALDGWYPGRPVLVTRNDYGLGLMNGDIGVCLTHAGADGTPRLRVAFPAPEAGGGIRWVLPSRLQAVETVYAMTVHKSQGSEFGEVALVLPERPSPILTRELLYTGITRARSRLLLACAGGLGVVRGCVERRVARAGGLEESL